MIRKHVSQFCPRDIIWMGTWMTLHPRQILDAPGAISIYGSPLPEEPRTRALRFGSVYSTDWTTAAHFFER